MQQLSAKRTSQSRKEPEKNPSAIGQRFAPITEGDFYILKGLGKHAARAGWILARLRIRGGKRQVVTISASVLGDVTGLSPNTVRAGLNDLLDLGLIRKSSGLNLGRLNSENTYEIMPPPTVEPVVQNLTNGCAKFDQRCAKFDQPEETGKKGDFMAKSPFGAVEPVVQNLNNGCSKFEQHKELDNTDNIKIDIFLDGKNRMENDLGRIMTNLRIGPKQIPELIEKMTDAALDKEDLLRAAMIATKAYHKGKTDLKGRNHPRVDGEGMGIIARYIIGIIDRTIDRGLKKVEQSALDQDLFEYAKSGKVGYNLKPP